MKTFKYFLVVLVFISTISKAQNSEAFYLQKSGFDKLEFKTNKDTITYLISKSKSITSKPVVLFVQGSQPLPLIFYDDKSANSIIPFSTKDYLEKFTFVIIARKGIPLIGTYDRDAKGYVNDKGEIPEDYTKNNNLNYRVNQVNTVLDQLAKNNNFKKDSIFVIGHSEGYRVVSKVAEKSNKIAKLVCMSADPFNRITESILRERIKSISSSNENLAQLEINKLIDTYKRIPLNKIEFKSNVGFKNWLSYNENLSYESLRKFKKPILIVYGTADIGSLHNDLLPFLLPENNLTLKAYPNYGHNFEKKEHKSNGESIQDSYHWDDVFQDVIKWLMSN